MESTEIGNEQVASLNTTSLEDMTAQEKHEPQEEKFTPPENVEHIVINTREDLDALIGFPAHGKFMEYLKGTLWRLQKNDEQKQWELHEDDSAIKRFGFERTDEQFKDAQAPELPIYVEPLHLVPTAITMRQARLALLGSGLLDKVEPAIASILDEKNKSVAEIEWQFSQSIERASEWFANITNAVGLTSEQVDSLFKQAGEL
jgi:hypothetical protein